MKSSTNSENRFSVVPFLVLAVLMSGCTLLPTSDAPLRGNGTAVEKQPNDEYIIISTNEGRDLLSVELQAVLKAAQITIQENRKHFIVTEASAHKLVDKAYGFTIRQSIKITVQLVPDNFSFPGVHPIDAQRVLDRWPSIPKLQHLVSGRTDW